MHDDSFTSRMLKSPPASFSHRSEAQRPKRTPRLFARCALLNGLFVHPAVAFSRCSDEQVSEARLRRIVRARLRDERDARVRGFRNFDPELRIALSRMSRRFSRHSLWGGD